MFLENDANLVYVLWIISLVSLISFALQSAAEIAMFDNNIIVYKVVQDLHFFVTGGDDENELILATVLQGFYDAVTLLLRYFYCHGSTSTLWLEMIDL